MRIRSTKPEFWRSKTIASLDWDARLVLKGLESYVDDNGVGKDSVVLIVADVFPHDLARDTGTLARVSRALAQLSEANLVARYEVGDEPLLYVRKWKSIQRIDKPAKGRWPRPDGTMEYTDEVDEKIRPSQSRNDDQSSGPSQSGTRDSLASPRETLATSPENYAPGTGEQGNRGTGDSAKAGGDAATPGPNATPTQQLVAEWIDHCQTRPPGQVIGQVSKLVKQLLDVDEIPYLHVRAGLIRWQTKGLHPSTLPSVVNEVINSRPAGDRRQTTTDDQFDRMLARAAERDAAQQKALEA